MAPQHKPKFAQWPAAVEAATSAISSANDNDNAALAGLRGTGLARFEATGLPTPNFEEWKFSNLKSLQKRGGLAQDIAPDLAALLTNPDYADQLTAVRGTHPLVDLNLALLQGGGYIETSGEIVLEGASNAHHRYVVRAKAGESVEVLVRCQIEGPEAAQIAQAFLNHVFVCEVEEGATLTFYQIVEGPADAVVNIFTQANVAASGTFNSYAISMGGEMVRLENQVYLQGEQAHAKTAAVSLLGDQRHCDITNRLYHEVGECTSDQVSKTVLADQARGVFQGKTYVARDAQQTDAYQLNNNLMLSRKAVINTKPELEIYADDVKCSHGATTTELDEDTLFYLKSRGLSEAEARTLLIESFVRDALSDVAHADFQRAATDILQRFLSDQG